MAFRKDITDEEAAAANAVAMTVRQWSKAGRLISELELCRQVAARQQPPFADRNSSLQCAITQTLQQQGDLHKLCAYDDTRYYYSSNEMTQGYASMLLKKMSDPARLLADVIRENSASYPRPVPLEMFTQPPFDLSREQVLDCLERMTGEEEYRDIASATTSASIVFLYSTLHMEAEHASMLAEWFDVGQLDNP